METRSPVTILFANIRTLNASKIATIEHLLATGRFDIVTVAETRFNLMDLLAASPFFLQHSDRYMDTSHTYGGVAVFAHPRLHSHLSTSSAPDAVLFSFGRLRLAVAYLPPGLLSDDDVPDRLSSLGPCDVILGDINASLGANSLRTTLVDDWLHHHRPLSWLRPEGNLPKWDHVLANPHLVSSYHTIPCASLPFETDHSHALVFTVPYLPKQPSLPFRPRRRAAQHTPFEPAAGVRFDFRPLYCGSIAEIKAAKKVLLADYAIVAPTIERALTEHEACAVRVSLFARNGGHCAPVTLMRIVRAVDDLLTNTLQSLARRLYPFRRHTAPKNNPLGDDFRSGAAVPTFLRLQTKRKALNRPRITTRDGTSPLAQAKIRFENLWQGPDADIAESPKYSPPPELWVTSVDDEKVRELLGEYDVLTSSGIDGVYSLLLRELRHSAFARHLACAFRIFLRLGTTPVRWNHALTVLVPKDDGETCDVDRTRPISVSPMFRRLFEKLVLQQVSPMPSFKLQAAQTGFQKGKSTMINLALLDAELQNKQVRTVLIDLADCYDRLSFAYQRWVWKKRRIPLHIQHLLYGLILREMTSVVSLNGQQSDVIVRRCGVPQGSLLSPLLYNLAADELIKDVQALPVPDEERETAPGLRPIGMFADDGTLQATTDTHLERQLTTVHAWTQKAGMRVSWRKCAALGTDRPLRIPEEGMGTLATAEGADYLGLPLCIDDRVRGIDWKTYYDRKIAATRRLLNYVNSVTATWHPRAKLELVRTLVRPRLEYMAGLFFWATALTSPPIRAKRSTTVTQIAPALREGVTYGPVWKALDAISDDMSRFALGLRTNQDWKLASSMLGLERPSIRFQELGHLAKQHLLRMKGVPAMNDAMQRLGMLHWKARPRLSIPMLQTELRKAKLSRLQNHYGKRGKLITDKARTPGGTDHALSLKSAQTTRAMIAWRRDVWGYGRYERCVCGAPYHYHHFVKCPSIVPPVSAALLDQKLEQVPLQEYRIAALFLLWDTQLEAANVPPLPPEGLPPDLESEDDGWVTPDEDGYTTPNEAI